MATNQDIRRLSASQRYLETKLSALSMCISMQGRGDAELYRQAMDALSPGSNECLVAGRRIASVRSLVHVAEMGTPCFAGEFARGRASDTIAVGYGKAAIVRAILSEEGCCVNRATG